MAKENINATFDFIDEEWREIENYPNYMVSNYGKVKYFDSTYIEVNLWRLTYVKYCNSYLIVQIRNKDIRFHPASQPPAPSADQKVKVIIYMFLLIH